uniref:Bowman-Birk serine protease inhibitors family domain-containing protein n=1 Tax=Oryza rufipogon TaxID=4529 RepID=A0A0E0R9M0_ORYRU
MKTNHMMIFSLLLLMLSSSDLAMADGKFSDADCKMILFPAYCDDIKTCIPLCTNNSPLKPAPSQLSTVVCLDLGCQCTFCPKTARN